MTYDPDNLTPTERAAERALAKEARDRVNKCCGCYCCLKRNHNTESKEFGLAECGLTPPAQFKKRGCRFEPDFKRIYPGRFEQD